MSKEFRAQYAGHCIECNTTINAGDSITWSRNPKKKGALHAACFKSVKGEVVTAEAGKPVTALVKPVATGKKRATKVSQWYEIMEALLDAGSGRLLLIGPPGTGKSFSAVQMRSDYTHRITMTEGTGIEDLVGMYQLLDGETKWVDGPATKALREGSRLLIDEIDHHPSEVGSLMYALLDDNPGITLPTGEPVVAKAGYTVIGTSNANISALPEAIIDRFETVLLAMTPHPGAMTGMSDAERNAVKNYYKGLRSDPYQWKGMSTLRRMRAFSRLSRSQNVDDDVLAQAVFGSAGKEILSVLSTASK